MGGGANMISMLDVGGNALPLAIAGMGHRDGVARLGLMVLHAVNNNGFLWAFPGLPTAAGRVKRDSRDIGGNSL